MDKRQMDERQKDGKTKRLSFCSSAFQFLALLLLCAACAAINSAQKVDDEFYKSSAQKMGVNFNGTENKELIKSSIDWLGVPYRYGGVKKRGVDCSGFVLNVYKEACGITLPRTTAGMAKQVKRIRKKDLQFGDLVFFSIKAKRASHVGIYMGGDKFVHASSSKGVSVASLSDAYWDKYYSGAGRVNNVEQLQPTAAKVAEKRQPRKRRTHSKTSARSNTKASHTESSEVIVDTSSISEFSAPTAISEPSSSSSDSLIFVFDEEF
jgi:lipoprotein Spr